MRPHMGVIQISKVAEDLLSIALPRDMIRNQSSAKKHAPPATTSRRRSLTFAMVGSEHCKPLSNKPCEINTFLDSTFSYSVTVNARPIPSLP